MRKIISGSKISFYDDNDNEIMYLDHSFDECIWCFNSSDIITVTSNMELFYLLKNIMDGQYTFSDSGILKSYKKDNKLVWYSDCYYNPDDEMSISSISYLSIEYSDDCFKLWCTKPLDEVINRKHKSHCIGFSPLGNGQNARNVLTGSTLQTDFVLSVYNQLLNHEKVKNYVVKK